MPTAEKRNLSAQHLVYGHSKGVTVRGFRRAAVFETEILREEEFWAHPPDRASLCGRRGVRGFRYDRK